MPEQIPATHRWTQDIANGLTSPFEVTCGNGQSPTSWVTTWGSRVISRPSTALIQASIPALIAVRSSVNIASMISPYLT